MTSFPPVMEVPSVDAAQCDLRLLGERYQLLEVIGRGGMATVYRASDAKVGREVAVKVLDPTRTDPVHRERFLLESRLSAGLSHGNIVDVFDTGETDGVCFIAMELLRGRTLAELLSAEGTLQWERALKFSRQIGAGLAFAHRQGLVHRDLKPANCFVEGAGDSERLKLLDFGLAKSVRAAEGSPEPELTSNTELLGSPTYMAPELARGQVVVETDIYAVGVILYRMLAGRPPFRGRTPVDVIAQHLQAPVPWFRELTSGPVAPIELELVMRQCLEKDPGARYASVEALLAALDAAEEKVRGGPSQPDTAPDRAPTPPPLPRLPRLPRSVTATIRRPRPPPAPHLPPVLYPAPMPKWVLGLLRVSKGVWLPAAGAAAATMAAALTVGAVFLWRGPSAPAPREPAVAAEARPNPVEPPMSVEAPMPTEPPSPAPAKPPEAVGVERQSAPVKAPAIDQAGLAAPEANRTRRSTSPPSPSPAPASQSDYRSDPYE